MNPILLLAKKYYLKKISQGKLSKEYVARLYSTSSENIESALLEYKSRKNPFRKKDDSIRQGRINIIVSVVSSIFVLFTLFEMQAERNLAYMPNVYVNSSGVKFRWDQSHDIFSNDVEMTEEDQKLWKANDYTQGLIVNFAIQNTGVGTATEVSVDWLYEENVRVFQQFFSENDNIAVDIEDNILSVQYQGLTIGKPISKKGQYVYGFLTSDPNQKEMITIPDTYVLLYEYAYANFLHESIPHIRFILNYKDIQGKNYSKTFTINPSPELVIMHPDGHGVGAVNFVITEEQDTTSIYLVFISVIIGIGIILSFANWIYRKRKASI